MRDQPSASERSDDWRRLTAMETNAVWYDVACIYVGIVIVFGVSILFVRAQNIERRVMVAGLTVITGFIGAWMLYLGHRDLSNSQLLGIAALATLGYIAGRLIDFYMGPKPVSPDPGMHSLGSDYAD